jgi:NADP-dependent 3-hydroxy acid dehydrogenase YdfG
MTKQGVQQFSDATAISAEDIAGVISFALSRPRSVSLSEILVRPTAQIL